MRSRQVAVSTAGQAGGNGQRASRMRRQRGYRWEDTLVKRFRACGGWQAFRLGSPSVSLPDVLAVSTESNSMCSIEAKSGTGTSLMVPYDQIERCLQWVGTFDIYKERRAILAFKFLSKKRVGLGRYEGRQLREYFKVWDDSYEPADCVCTYDGRLYARVGGERVELQLRDAEMPFVTGRNGAKARRA